MTARRNLELTETLRAKEKKGSLLWVLDKTKTPMGARNLRSWLQQPLLNPAAIDRRLNAVGALVDNDMARQELRLALTGIGDMERLMGRISFGTAGGRELVSLRSSMEQLPAVKAQLAAFPWPAGGAERQAGDAGRPVRSRSPGHWWTSRRSPCGRAA